MDSLFGVYMSRQKENKRRGAYNWKPAGVKMKSDLYHKHKLERSLEYNRGNIAHHYH